MKSDLADRIFLDEHMGCFGEFNISDPICKKHCALALRCAIEREQNDRYEILEDLVSADMALMKVQ